METLDKTAQLSSNTYKRKLWQEKRAKKCFF
jgi:hypothetical protein